MKRLVTDCAAAGRTLTELSVADLQRYHPAFDEGAREEILAAVTAPVG